jgi:hypothetical protein
MACVVENYSKIEVLAVVGFLQAEGVSQSEINRRLVSVYGWNVSSRKESLCGQRNLKIAERLLVKTE